MTTRQAIPRPTRHDGPRATETPRRSLVFRLGGHVHSLRLRDVAGVGPAVPPTRVPGAPSGVLGLVTWHGRILAVVDLAQRLGLPPEPATAGCLVRLAPPHEHVALQLNAVVHLASPPRESPGEDEPTRCLLPRRLLDDLDRSLAG